MRRFGATLLVATVFGPGALWPVRAAAQSRSPLAREPVPPPLFAPSRVEPNYEQHYTRLEECLVAVPRTRARARWGVLELTDDRTRPEPVVVVEAARRCAARFDVATVSPADLPLLRELYHHAEQDSLAEAVLRRELALLPATASPADRAELVQQAARFALHFAHPARVDWAERRLQEIDQGGWDARLQRLDGYYQLAQYAAALYDTLRLDRYTSAAVALFDSLPESEREHHPLIRGAMRQVRELQLLRALDRGDAVSSSDSTPAPPIVADFWFRRPDPAPPPTRGRGGLVLFVDPACEVGCYDRYALLRRLHERVGDALEITLVAHTDGYFRNHRPMEPAGEAELLRHYFHEHLELPGALAVETTRARYLPSPDGRRVDQAPANVQAYRPDNLLVRGAPAFGIAFSPSLQHDGGGTGYLVDRDGRILLRLAEFGRGREPLLVAAIAGWLGRRAEMGGR